MAPLLAAYAIYHWSGRAEKPIGVLIGLGVVILAARRPALTLTILILAFPFEDFILGFLFGLHVPFAVLRALGDWKELTAAVLVITALRKHREAPRRLDRIDAAAAAYLLCIAAWYVFPHVLAQSGAIIQPTYVRQLAARQDGLFVLIFLAARHARLGGEWAERIAVPLMVVGAAVAAMGLYQYMLPASWASIATNTFHVVAYQQRAINRSTAQLNPVGSLNGVTDFRIGSVLLNPLTLGSWLIAPLAVSVERIARGGARFGTVVATALIGSALLLTLTRSAILSGLIVLVLTSRIAPGRTPERRVRFGLLAIGLLILSIPLAISSHLIVRTTSAANGTDQSSTGHVKAFTIGVDGIVNSPMGRGLGTAPGIGQRYNVTGEIQSENYYLQVGDELGFPAFLAFILFTVLSLKRLARAQRAGPGAVLASAIFDAGVGLAVGAFLLHVWADFTIAVTFWALAGVVVSLADEAETGAPPSVGALVVAPAPDSAPLSPTPS